MMSASGRAVADCVLIRAAVLFKNGVTMEEMFHLNLKEDPRVKSIGFGLALGSSKRRKKA